MSGVFGRRRFERFADLLDKLPVLHAHDPPTEAQVRLDRMAALTNRLGSLGQCLGATEEFRASLRAVVVAAMDQCGQEPQRHLVTHRAADDMWMSQ